MTDWLATEYVKQHDANLSMSVEMGAPGTWAWYLRDERLKHWVAATGTEATSLDARQAAERKLAEYEAKLVREQAIMWDANHDCRE